MADIGVPELVIILVIVIICFGPSRIGGLGKSLGEGIRWMVVSKDEVYYLAAVVVIAVLVIAWIHGGGLREGYNYRFLSGEKVFTFASLEINNDAVNLQFAGWFVVLL